MSSLPKKIAFQGAHGAYSDMACRAVFPDYKTLPCTSFDEAFQAVTKGQADLGMIPVDNTLAGRVADVHHLMEAQSLYITGEFFLPVEHCLLGVKGADINALEHVHSHIHAIPQCRKLISRLGLNAHIHADTAGAAKDVAARGDAAHGAIASKLAAEIYDLDILEQGVQDEHHNTTRFLILSKTQFTPDYDKNKDYMTSLIFEVRNIPAALYKSMGGFATNGLSFSKLESYVGENFQVAQFYCDIEGHYDSVPFKLAIEELEFYAKNIRFLGTYLAHDFRNR